MVQNTDVKIHVIQLWTPIIQIMFFSHLLHDFLRVPCDLNDLQYSTRKELVYVSFGFILV